MISPFGMIVSSKTASLIASSTIALQRLAPRKLVFSKSEIIKEIGSGLNYNRKKLKTILERVMSGDVKRIVVGHEDRLARFGFELLKWICILHNTELVVCNNEQLSPERNEKDYW